MAKLGNMSEAPGGGTGISAPRITGGITGKGGSNINPVYKPMKVTKQIQLENKQSKSFVNQYSKDAKKKGVGEPGLIAAAPKSVANYVGPKVPVKKK